MLSKRIVPDKKHQRQMCDSEELLVMIFKLEDLDSQETPNTFLRNPLNPLYIRFKQ